MVILEVLLDVLDGGFAYFLCPSPVPTPPEPSNRPYLPVLPLSGSLIGARHSRRK